MSAWTQVNGSIRIRRSGWVNLNFDKIFKVANWDNEESIRTCNMPSGSEGSLKYSVYEDDKQYVVSIFGALRDFSLEQNGTEISEWLQSKLWVLNHYPNEVISAIIEVWYSDSDNIHILRASQGRSEIEVEEFTRRGYEI